MKIIYDVVIIGAGPVGLYAAYLTGEKGLSTAIVDALPEVGGQLIALYPQKDIFDVAGYPQVTAVSLVKQLKEQALSHSPKMELNLKVIEMLPENSGEYKIISEDGRYLYGKHIILAAGAGMINPRKLGIENEEDYLGKGLEYVIQDVEDYLNKKILIVGGGDTALDWANYFVEKKCDVTLIHRTDRFVGFEGSLKKLEASPAKIFTFCKIKTILGNDKIEKVEIIHNKEKWTKTLDVDSIIACVGFSPRLGFIKKSNFEIAESSVKADNTMQTALENIYAVGDISNHPGRIKLISTGFGNVQIAVSNIVRRLKDQATSEKEAQLEKNAGN